MAKVFISSVIGGFEAYRAAAVQAVTSMGHQAVTSEKFGARPYSSEVACVHEIEQCDIYLLIQGANYGSKTPEGISVTHAEYRAARDASRHILAFIQNVDMEADQLKFKNEVEEYQSGVFRASFSTTEELMAEIVQALRQFDIMQNAASLDMFEDRVQAALQSQQETSYRDPQLVVTCWPQPTKTVDIVGLEAELDHIFNQCCQSGITSLRDGYEPKTGHDWTGLHSGAFSYAQFDDGLVLLTLAMPDNSPRILGASFISPSKLQAIIEGCYVLFGSTSGFVKIELRNMEGTYVAEAPSGNSMYMPAMTRQESLHFSKLFLPLSVTAYNQWSSLCLSRFGRTFGYESYGGA